MSRFEHFEHVRLSRRSAVQAGAIGLLGLGANHLESLRAMAVPGSSAAQPPAKAVIFIFLSGGLAQHDSFDMKPAAPDEVRGEFRPIATSTPGIEICEHLPLLAARSHRWALVRSLAHAQPEHSAGHMLMLSGRSQLPPGFDRKAARPGDWPSIAAVANTLTAPRNNLPPAIVLPEPMVHRTGHAIPGQGAGEMGGHRDPMFLQLTRYNPKAYGAMPQYGFHHQTGPMPPDKDFAFQAPNLSLPEGLDGRRFRGRLELLELVDRQRKALDRAAEGQAFDQYRQKAVSLLVDPRVRRAFDVSQAAPRTLDRYGRNTFGWSLLLARQLVEAGVNMVQVNLGNNETWDTHGNAFPNLKNQLFPPTDRALSALIDDLDERGMLDSTLLVMAGEMGRTPRISRLKGVYDLPGRDHWGTQTVWFAGGGVQPGNVIGSTDKLGAYPAASPQKPENMAASIYQALGIPRELAWHDANGRPHFVYHGEPIRGLSA
ncbi:MAG TPA: DUF1501 domain-containing protein [Pirellulales bacterium]|nr:DUF1501 domain-containing protein [Pirellulales bacterium]